jgi:type IV pilus assembly protein PilX
MSGRRHAELAQRGFVLVSSLLLLIVVTLLAVGMFRSFGVDEKIAGNTRDKQVAVQAAESAEEFAENWLALNIANNAAANNGAALNDAVPAIACAGFTPSTAPQVCNTELPNPSQLPWAAGVNYTLPANTLPNNGIAITSNPIAQPSFYIWYKGQIGSYGYEYEIDAVGYGSSPNTVAIVDSLYVLKCTTCSGDN